MMDEGQYASAWVDHDDTEPDSWPSQSWAQPATSAEPRRRMAMTVCSLLNRDKEWLAEEVVRLSTLSRGLEDVNRRSVSQARRLAVQRERAEMQLHERSAAQVASSAGDPSSSNMVSALKERLKEQKALNTALEERLTQLQNSNRAIRVNELEVANTLYLQEVKRLTALLRATSADSGDGGGGSDRRSPKRPQSVFGRSSLDQSKLSMQNVYEAPPLFTPPADTRKALKGVKAELEETRRRYGVLDMAHRALKVQLGDAHAANVRLEKQLDKALAPREHTAAAERERKKGDSDKAKDDGGGADALQLRELKKRQTWLESKVEELTEDCERMKREREGLKRQSDLEKAAHKRLAEETALKTAELARSRDQVRRLQRERLCDPLPVNEEV